MALQLHWADLIYHWNLPPNYPSSILLHSLLLLSYKNYWDCTSLFSYNPPVSLSSNSLYSPSPLPLLKVRIVTSCRHLLAGFPIFGLWVLRPTDNLPPLSEPTQSIQLNLLPFSKHKLYKPSSFLALSCESPLKQVWPWGRHYPP